VVTPVIAKAAFTKVTVANAQPAVEKIIPKKNTNPQKYDHIGTSSEGHN
jgi:hypothetical protein